MLEGLAVTALMATNPGAVRERSAPKIIAYSAQPNPYFNEQAARIAEIYDGFFFTIGSWDEGVAANLGVPPDTPPATQWKEQARENLAHLRQAGVTESLLGIHFSDSAPWPSPDTLLSKEYTEKLRRHFTALGKAAKELGFQGVSIDIEYPYKRYELDHEVYAYNGYTADDLVAAAHEQGRVVIEAVLSEFPEAAVFVLPGELWSRPLGRAFMLAVLSVMAEKDAPGGFHLGYERAYCLLDPASQVAIPRVGDCMVRLLADEKSVEYWKRRCSVAPGVWPTHMVETGGEDYPVRPWSDELAELTQQMAILRSVAKRYVWSFSGQPAWFQHTPEIEAKYGLAKQSYDGVDEVIPGWHRILAESKKALPSALLQGSDARIKRLVRAVEEFDRGRIGCGELCDRFGTPADWLLLGPLGNPFTHPEYSAADALLRPIRLDEAIHGRDGAVRWFVFRNHEPTGSVRLMPAFDWRNTDDCSVHAACVMSAPKELKGYMWINWDDGVVVWIGDKLVFDHRTYPERGHGLLYRDRYNFEERVPVVIPKGESRLAVTCINSHGQWGFNIRFADEDGFPLEGLRFSLPPR